MEHFTYDPCFLITKPNIQSFGIIGMQTDDTLCFSNDAFSNGQAVNCFGRRHRVGYVRMGTFGLGVGGLPAF